MSEEVAKVPESPVEPAKPPAAMVVSKTPEEVQADFLKMVPSHGSVESSVEQRAILFAPVNPDEVLIRPDGLVYLSWTAYVKRLRDAFGTQWSLMPRGNPAVRDGMIMAAYYLCIQGKVAGYAVGEAQQQGQMTYGDVLESAKSNALTRLCKGMGISLELWDPSFVRTWKEKYAVQDVPSPKRSGEFLWRRKDAESVTPGPPVPTVVSPTKVSVPIVPPISVLPAPVDIAKEVAALFTPKGINAIPPSPPENAWPVDVKALVEALSGAAVVVTNPEPSIPGPAPSGDPHDAPVAGSVGGEAIVKVKLVNVHKPGLHSRQKNPSYRIIDTDDKIYYTFDKTLAVIAREAQKSGASVKISFEVTNYGFKANTVVSGPFDAPLPLGAA